MLTVRDMVIGDVPACCALLNHIVAAGGTTAHEEPFTQDSFATSYFAAPVIVLVVLDGDRVAGFQALFDDGDRQLSIGTFTDRQDPVRGAGRALFSRTRARAAAWGARAIVAKITADNAPGLGYYSRMGFEDWRTEPGAARRAGRPLDRIVKRYRLP